MKKLILLFAGMLFAGFIFGQSLSLSDDQGNPFTPGQTVYVIGEPAIGPQIPIHVWVTNNGTAAMEVNVARTEDNVLPGVTDEFCWGGACFPPGTDTSFLTANIDPGATNTEFEAKYTHNDIFGESQYTYTWYDVNNPSDQVSVVVIFKLSNVGVSELLDNVQLSQAYPNPANAYAFFNFSIPGNITNANLVISNLLGAVVMEVPVSGSNGKVRINTSDLNNGIYFGSLKIGNQITSTHRLVVSH